MSKEEIKIKQTKLVELTSSFCEKYLDDDYKNLTEKLILKLGRKRDVPFKSGKLEIWAAAVIHTIGSINFLFDKSFQPFVSADQISDFFETNKKTVSSKATQIKTMLKIDHFDSEFSTQKMSENNPLHDLVMVNGFMVPLSSIPEEFQEVVRQERAAGRDIQFTSE